MVQKKKGKQVNLETKPTKIMLYEKGSAGLDTYGGFVREAYNTKLTWPTVYPTYDRIYRSNPEVSMVSFAYSAWIRNSGIEVDVPDEASEADEEYAAFLESVFEDAEGGVWQLLEQVINSVFFGWSWMSVVPGVRSQDWKPPNEDDDWCSEYDDGLIGIRRFAWRDQSTFNGWIFSDTGKVLGFHQQDPPHESVDLYKDEGLHIVFGDPNNPEGKTPMEAVWRVERIKYGLEVVNGIAMEHTAGYLSVQKTGVGSVSKDDNIAAAKAARAILSAQDGNYALWPSTINGEVKDIGYSAASAMLENIKYYGVTTLSAFLMQWIALSATTGSGSYAAMDESSNMGVLTFNAMLDGFAKQVDDQVGKRLWNWNKDAFPGVTKRPKIKFTHLSKDADLGVIGSFISQLGDTLRLTDSDIKSVRAMTGFLGEQLGDEKETPITEEERGQLALNLMREKMYEESRKK